MKKGTLGAAGLAGALVLGAVAVGMGAPEPEVGSTTLAPVVVPATATVPSGLIHGRVTTDDGEIYEGRLRFGGDEEALWSNYFNGVRKSNPWIGHAPGELLPRKRMEWDVFGVVVAIESQADLGRPFMARFGDIRRLEARGSDLYVTLRSGTVVHLDRYAADDYADGVRVWDTTRGTVDLGERQIRSIEFLPGFPTGPAAAPLYGTVRTAQGEFTGLVQWNRESALLLDELHGRTRDGEVSVRFDAIRSIVRETGEGARVTLDDGREIALTGARRDGTANRGVYVDDPRYGRVLVSWDAFERIDFTPGATAPTYEEFGGGQPLAGTVITRSGRRVAGRLVYDLDESESIETLDAPRDGVDYTIPFTRIESIAPWGVGGSYGAVVRLRGGGQIELERAGDLAAGNAGMLVFPRGGENAEYIPWSEVERVHFGSPAVASASE